MQFTAQQFGGALGTALIGAVVVGGSAGALRRLVADNPTLSQPVKGQVGVALESGVAFVPADQVTAAARVSTEPMIAAASDDDVAAPT